MWRRVQVAGLLFSLLAALIGLSAGVQQNPKRLVLKDGSYQAVTQWEVKGDRVRYYSAERYAWEEIPGNLVDWPATEKYNQERGTERTATVERAIQLEGAERLAEEAKAPILAPGLQLPENGGVFLLDDFHREPQLVELIQNGGELNKQTGKNILRAALNPLALSSRQTIELKGGHASVQAHVPQPAIYVDVNSSNDSAPAPEQPDLRVEQEKGKSRDKAGKNHQGGGQDKETGPPADPYRIVRVEQKKGNRILGSLNVAVTGHTSQKENLIKTTSTPVGEWVKITPAEPLDPGEYALVEMLDQKQINLYVWDFGVDPSAPANPGAWSSRKQAQPEPSSTPDLQKRPKN